MDVDEMLSEGFLLVIWKGLLYLRHGVVAYTNAQRYTCEGPDRADPSTDRSAIGAAYPVGTDLAYAPA